MVSSCHSQSLLLGDVERGSLVDECGQTVQVVAMGVGEDGVGLGGKRIKTVTTTMGTMQNEFKTGTIKRCQKLLEHILLWSSSLTSHNVNS